MADRPGRRTLEDQLNDIPQLDNVALGQAWAALFGRPPSPTTSRRLLELAAAYEAQAKVHGGLSKASRRKLLEAARRQAGTADRRSRKRQGALTPGSRLVREWHGRSHTVEVAERGFLYAGQQYRSLSEVARAITGTRWSGPRFFGL
jgi:hypothetical protein